MSYYPLILTRMHICRNLETLPERHGKTVSQHSAKQLKQTGTNKIKHNWLIPSIYFLNVLFKAKIITVAPELIVLARTLPTVNAQACHWCKYGILKSVWDLCASRDLDYTGCMQPFHFYNFLKIPHLLLQLFRATLFCCEAPEMFCR